MENILPKFQMTQTDLTVIVLTYNSADVIADCLSNINYDKCKVIVVDNGSTDTCLELVEKNFPQTKIIRTGKNIGFARANNIALEQTDTEFALVLNPDAIIRPKDVEIVLDRLKNNAEVAIAGPMMFEESEVSDEELSRRRFKIEKDFHTIKDMYYQKIGDDYDSRFISGACMFLRMAVFKELGFLDGRIFMFYEDDEICIRAKRNGYKNLTVTGAIAHHVGGSSCKKTWSREFRRSWHLKGWSKLHWKRVRKGEFKAKKSALRLTLIHLVKSLVSLIKFDSDDLAKNLGIFLGSLAFLLGFGAFKRNGTPRG